MALVVNWIRQNKLSASLLAIIFAYLLFKSFLFPGFRPTRRGPGLTGMKAPGAKISEVAEFMPPIPQPEYAPAPKVKERIIVQESSLSLLVKDIGRAQEAIKKKTQELGGYMVNATLANPQEAATGSITLRIPQSRLEEALDYFRGLAVKIVSENLWGRDVTDEYVDIKARLETLLKSKAKFEEILTKAEEVEEILQVQKELVSLQAQIDNLKGRENYLQKTAQMSKVTVYLSTDELALPYTPSEVWRPKVVFKQAVRSLVGTLRKLGSGLIWLGVYSVVWLPILVVWWILKKKGGEKNARRGH